MSMSMLVTGAGESWVLDCNFFRKLQCNVVAPRLVRGEKAVAHEAGQAKPSNAYDSAQWTHIEFGEVEPDSSLIGFYPLFSC